MGAWPKAYALIGIRIDKYALGTVPQYSCEHPDRIGKKFCPECGKAVTETIGPDENRWHDFFEPRECYTLPPGTEYIFLNVTDHYTKDSYCLVGWGLSANPDSKGTAGLPGYKCATTIPSEADIRKAIKSIIGDEWADLYNEETFGFHVYQYYG